MDTITSNNRIHPLFAGAAVSVILVSLLGAAAITGILPSSHGTAVPAPVSLPANSSAADEQADAKPVVHHHHSSYRAMTASAQPVQYATQAPVYQQTPVYSQPAPVAHNSPVGIGVGAVVGGLIGNQIGGGSGRTLATIAGTIGGGYIGNEIAKRNQ